MLGRIGALVVVVVVAAVGCDDSYPWTTEEKCEQLRERWSAAIQPVSRACSQDGDCTLAGGVTAPTGSFSIPVGWDGEPVNAQAYAGSSAAAIEADYDKLPCGSASDPICSRSVYCNAGECMAPLTCCWGCPVPGADGGMDAPDAVPGDGPADAASDGPADAGAD